MTLSVLAGLSENLKNWHCLQYSHQNFPTSIAIGAGVVQSSHTHSATPERRVRFVVGMIVCARMRWADHLNKVRIILADDHPGFPEIAEHLLESNFEVVAKVGNGQAMFDAAMRLQPDVIISDISMPILNGLDAAERLKKSGCKARVIFLTIHSDSEFIRKCLFNGAFGYVAKSRISTELVPAIHEALAGHIFVSQHISDRSSA
jgi:CheY-like chemotaxis protein